MNRKIGIILGTRPEIIKMAPVVRVCQKKSIDFFILHTNQHYSQNMDKVFFDELELPQPRYNLSIGSGTHGEMTGKMMVEIEKVLEKEKPSVVLVQGDTNTVLAGALVASKMDIKVGHVEGGLRSYDRTMPEELNRVVADHVSDYIFAPTENQGKLAVDEGISKGKVHVVGNTIVDAIYQASEIAERKSTILNTLELNNKKFILMTSHRPATVDNKENLTVVIEAVNDIAEKMDATIVFPAHPRTVKMLESFVIKIPRRYKIIEPIGYLDMIQLMKESSLIVTDSGGIQEESCILEKKCVVIRENTERPEAVLVGGCVLAGNSDESRIVQESLSLMDKEIDWYNPFGDGTTAKQIMEICVD